MQSLGENPSLIRKGTARGSTQMTWTNLVSCSITRNPLRGRPSSRKSASGLYTHHHARDVSQEDKPAARSEQKPSNNSYYPAAFQTRAPVRTTPGMLQDVVTMFKTQPLEFDYWVDEGMVTGKIPEKLKGTYFRNGPGLQIGHQRYQRHYLDGDGCVLSLAFPGGGQMPRFTNKYVRTKGFVAEQEAGRPLFRNAFTRGSADGSSVFNPLDLSFKNVANTGVLYWAQQLWALWEVGRPYELNPHTLDTLGEDNMRGQIGQRMAGHYRVVREQDGQLRCVCFGTQVSISGTVIEFYEFDHAGQLAEKSKQSLQGFDIMPIHDILVTEHWYIVLLGPVKFHFWRLLSDYATSKCSLAELMEFDSTLSSKIMLFPRPGKFGPAGKQAQTESSSEKSSKRISNSQAGANELSSNGSGRKGFINLIREDIDTDQGLDLQGRGQYNLSRNSSSTGSHTAPDANSSSYGIAPSNAIHLDSGTEIANSLHAVPPDSSSQQPASSWGPGSTRTAETTVPEKSKTRRKGTRQAELPPPVVIQGPSFFSFHHVNAFEVQGGAQIVMDTIGWQDLKVDVTQHNVTEDYFSNGCRSHLHRLLLDIPTARTRSCTRLLRRTIEFPTFNHKTTGLPYRHAYFATDDVDDEVVWAPAQVLLKVTLPEHGSTPDQSMVPDPQVRLSSCRDSSSGIAPGSQASGVVTSEWKPGERCFIQEPLFVPKPDSSCEDDGWIIVAVHNAESLQGEIAILDAQRIEDGPVAMIRLPHALPYGLHGTWTPDYLGPDPHDPSVPRWREPNRVREL